MLRVPKYTYKPNLIPYVYVDTEHYISIYRYETEGVQDASWGREETERAHQANPKQIPK